MAIEENSIRQKDLGTTCPHLGLKDDNNSLSYYPSSVNVCHRCKPIETPALSHQREVCLDSKYKDCEAFNQAAGKRMPKPIRKNQKLVLTPAFYLTAALAIVLAGLVFMGFRFGFFQNFYALAQASIAGETPVNVTMIPTQRPQINTPTATLLSALAAIEEPTLTPSPTDTLIPTITPTYACQYTIRLRGMSYEEDLAENQLYIAYDLPVDVDDYRMLDEDDLLTLRLDIPTFILEKNGAKVVDYYLYLRDDDTPDLLFILLEAYPGNIIEFEFSDAEGRYCSRPVHVATEDQIIDVMEAMFPPFKIPGGFPPGGFPPGATMPPGVTGEPTGTETGTPTGTETPTETVTPSPTDPTETETPSPTDPTQTDTPSPTDPTETDTPSPTDPTETDTPSPTDPTNTETTSPTPD